MDKSHFTQLTKWQDEIESVSSKAVNLYGKSLDVRPREKSPMWEMTAHMPTIARMVCVQHAANKVADS